MKNGGGRLLCRECGHQFRPNGRFPRMRTPPEVVAEGLSLYFDGMSLAKVRRHPISRFHRRVSRQAIWAWIVKFSNLVDAMAAEFRPGSSGLVEIDETAVFVRGRQVWPWDAIDVKTRYVLATHISEGRTVDDAKAFLRVLARRSERPKVVITDGLQSYNDAMRKVFYSRYADRRVKHQRSPGINTGDKNRIERWHGTLKERYKVMRGLKNMETGHAILRGLTIQYDLMRPHMALGDRTPAQASGIDLPFEDGWANLIDWATIYQTRRRWERTEDGDSADA